ncbi:MAG: PLP-dependent lyase/thiolase [Thermoleophilaceae bacterium]|nr:PLP-dependent lyase/thiolase [Thermoleophilaceae bacterium]
MPTPLEEAPASLAGGRSLFLKREDLHELGAFKWRGALPALRRYRDDGGDAVVTASTGNHGAATAWAADRVGVRAVVFGPEDASRAKVAVMEELGAELHLVGADLDEAKERARAFAAERRLPFFEDAAEPAQFDGYAEIATELVEQLGRRPAATVVPVGNGALLIRIARQLREGERVGVVAKEAPVMALSVAVRCPIECDRCATFADGMADSRGGPPRRDRARRPGSAHGRGLGAGPRARRQRLRRGLHPRGGLGRGAARRAHRDPGGRRSRRADRDRPQHRRRAAAGGGGPGELPAVGRWRRRSETLGPCPSPS